MTIKSDKGLLNPGHTIFDEADRPVATIKFRGRSSEADITIGGARFDTEAKSTIPFFNDTWFAMWGLDGCRYREGQRFLRNTFDLTGPHNLEAVLKPKRFLSYDFVLIVAGEEAPRLRVERGKGLLNSDLIVTFDAVHLPLELAIFCGWVIENLFRQMA